MSTARNGASRGMVATLRIQAGIRRVGRTLPLSDAAVAATVAARRLLHEWRTAAPGSDCGTIPASQVPGSASTGAEAEPDASAGRSEFDRYDLLVPGMTALHVAAAEGGTAGLRMLVRAGAPLDAVDVLGRTALHCAAAAGRRRQCLLLIALGGDAGMLRAREKTGRTAMQLAAGRGYVGVCDALAAMAGAAAGGVLVQSIVKTVDRGGAGGGGDRNGDGDSTGDSKVNQITTGSIPGALPHDTIHEHVDVDT